MLLLLSGYGRAGNRKAKVLYLLVGCYPSQRARGSIMISIVLLDAPLFNWP